MSETYDAMFADAMDLEYDWADESERVDLPLKSDANSLLKSIWADAINEAVNNSITWNGTWGGSTNYAGQYYTTTPASLTPGDTTSGTYLGLARNNSFTSVHDSMIVEVK